MSTEADYLLSTAQAGVDAATAKVAKAKADLEDAKDALGRAKDELRQVETSPQAAPESEPVMENAPVEAHAETAQIKGEA